MLPIEISSLFLSPAEPKDTCGLIHLLLQLLFSCSPESIYFGVHVVCGVSTVLAAFHIILSYFSEVLISITVAVSHLSFKLMFHTFSRGAQLFS